MTRGEFEAEIVREGYEVREGAIEPNVNRELHAHGFDARLFVLEGALTLALEDGRTTTFTPGDSCSVPVGTLHAEVTDARGVRYVFGRRTPRPEAPSSARR